MYCDIPDLFGAFGDFIQTEVGLDQNVWIYFRRISSSESTRFSYLDRANPTDISVVRHKISPNCSLGERERKRKGEVGKKETLNVNKMFSIYEAPKKN